MGANRKAPLFTRGNYGAVSVLVYLCVLALGIGLRFVHLDGQEFYLDEVAALAQSTGHNAAQPTADLFARGELSAGELLKYQEVDPNRGLLETVSLLIWNAPLSPPLYYVMCRGWIGVFGGSIYAVRALSVLLNLLVLSALWHLLVGLFKSRSIAGFGVLLASVSPFQYLLAVNAREYGLWMLFLCLATLFYFRRDRWKYITVSVLSLYTSILTVVVFLGHSIGYWIHNRLTLQKTKASRWVFTIFVFFTPWLILIALHWPGLNRYQWMTKREPILSYLMSIVSSFYKIFFDLDIRSTDNILVQLESLPVILFIYLLEVLSFRALLKDARTRSTGILLLVFFAITFVPTIGLDLLLGGHRAMSPRYHCYAFLIVQIAVIHYLGQKIWSSQPRQRFVGLTCSMILILAGAFSQYRMAHSTTWWNKTYGSDAHEIATHLPVSEPVLVVAPGIFHLITTARYLEPSVHLTLESVWNQHPELKGFKHVYFMRGSDEEAQTFAHRNHALLSAVVPGLWSVQLLL